MTYKDSVAEVMESCARNWGEAWLDWKDKYITAVGSSDHTVTDSIEGYVNAGRAGVHGFVTKYLKSALKARHITPEEEKGFWGIYNKEKENFREAPFDIASSHESRV